MKKISRKEYVSMYGPTTGDKVRLGDTDLIAEVEHDYTIYGEELKFGGGKTLREGMSQSNNPSKEELDLIITNALIVDYTAFIKRILVLKMAKSLALAKAVTKTCKMALKTILAWVLLLKR